MLNIVILASGNGSNFQAIAERANELNINIKALIANKKDAFALERAQQFNIPSIVVEHQHFADRASFDQALDAVIKQQGEIDYIILAGFMRVLTPGFVEKHRAKIINLHPSLLPKYKGLHTYARAIADKELYHGMTIHFVNEVLDEGPMILQAKVKIEPEDNVTTLAAKVQAQEHKYYPLVIQWLAEGRIKLVDNQVYFDAEPLPPQGILFD